MGAHFLVGRVRAVSGTAFGSRPALRSVANPNRCVPGVFRIRLDLVIGLN